MVKVAQSLAHWVLRPFKPRGLVNMRILLKSLVVPKLEYACPVWSPTDKGSINLIENVQKQLTRKIREFLVWEGNYGSWLCQTPYWDRLKALHIYSLQRRRDRYLFILIYKMVAGLHAPVGFSQNDIRSSGRRNISITPVYSKGGRKRKWVQTLQHHSFAAQAIRLFNVLPPELRVIHASVDVFKSRLDGWLVTVPDEPDTPNRTTAAPSNSLVDQVTYLYRNLP